MRRLGLKVLSIRFWRNWLRRCGIHLGPDRRKVADIRQLPAGQTEHRDRARSVEVIMEMEKKYQMALLLILAGGLLVIASGYATGKRENSPRTEDSYNKA